MLARYVAVSSLLAVATVSAFTVPRTSTYLTSVREWMSTASEARSGVVKGLRQSSSRAVHLSLTQQVRKSSKAVSQKFRSMTASMADHSVLARRAATGISGAGRRGSHEEVIPCDNITSDASEMFATFSDPGDADCIMEDMETLFLAMSEADRPAAMDKICSYTGESSDTSCGAGSGMDWVSQLVAKYDDKNIEEGCEIENGDDVFTPEEFVLEGKRLLTLCDAMSGTEYCYLKAMAVGLYDGEDDDSDAERRVSHEGDDDDAPPTKEELDVMCLSDCKALADAEMEGEDGPSLDSICTKGSDGNYCILSFVDTMPKDDEPLDADALDAICLDPNDPCAGLMADMMAMVVSEEDDGPPPMSPEGMIDMLCTKDGGEYCMLKMGAMFDDDEGNRRDSHDEDAPPSKEDLDNMCGPCMKTMMPYIISSMMGEEEGGEERRMSHGEGPSPEDMQKQMEAMMGFMCLKEGGEYCLTLAPPDPEEEEEEGDQEEGDLPTEDELQFNCGPCGQAYLEAFGGARRDSHELPPASYMRMLCTQHKGKFCLLDQGAATFLSALGTGVSGVEASMFCEQPCVSKSVFAQLNVAKESGEAGVEDLLFMLNGACFQEGSKYCVEVMFSDMAALADASVVDDVCPFEGDCTDDCKAEIEPVKAAFGCCVRSISEASELEWIENTCNIAAPACGGSSEIKFDVVVANLKYSWFKPKMSSYKEQIGMDVGDAIALAPGLVSLDGVEMSGDGSKLMLSATASNSAQSSAIQAAIKGGRRAAHSGGLDIEFQALAAALPDEAKVDPDVGMTGSVDTTSLLVDGKPPVDPDDSAAAHASAFPLLVALVSLLASLAVV